MTGSNGKTTTKDLLAAALQGGGASYATRGNLNSAQGVPVSLLDLTSAHRLAVIEMGASAVGHIAARARLAAPEVGVITNAAAAHLAEFGGLEQIIEGKGELVAALPADGTAILNVDSPGFAAWRTRAACPVVSWGQHDGRSPLVLGARRRRPRRGACNWTAGPGRCPCRGGHNAANWCAAILAARALGLTDAQIAAGLQTFRPSPHRAQLRRLGGRLVLDDAYNANPASMLAAAGMLCDLGGGEAVAVLGHMAELGPGSDALHRQCGAALADLGLACLLTVGEQAIALADGYRAAGGRAEALPDHAQAAERLEQTTRPGDRILIKGSRSATMERVIEFLEDRHAWLEESP